MLASLAVVLTAASFIFNAWTGGEGRPVRALWAGPLVETDGRLTAFRTWGSNGPPVVLIGGFVEPTFVWDTVAPRLARSHRVYALDLDGFGYTERRGPWTLAAWADQVQAFTRRLGIVRPIVVGHSLGAAVAVELARRGLASRVVLLGGDATTSGGPPWFVRTVVARTPFVTSGLRLANRWDWPVKRILENAHGPNHPALDHAMVQRWTEQFKVDGAEDAFEEMARHSPPGFGRAALKAMRIRATVVWGDEDGVDPVAAGRRTAEDLRARFVLVPGAGHLSMLTDPGAVARAIEGR